LKIHHACFVSYYVCGVSGEQTNYCGIPKREMTNEKMILIGFEQKNEIGAVGKKIASKKESEQSATDK
jgi:hypothetical protein